MGSVLCDEYNGIIGIVFSKSIRVLIGKQARCDKPIDTSDMC